MVEEYLQSGNCVFTFPNGPIKCAGAPQKAAYITDSLLRQRGVRQQAKMLYVTSLPKVDYIVHLKLKQSCVFSGHTKPRERRQNANYY